MHVDSWVQKLSCQYQLHFLKYTSKVDREGLSDEDYSIPS